MVIYLQIIWSTLTIINQSLLLTDIKQSLLKYSDSDKLGVTSNLYPMNLMTFMILFPRLLPILLLPSLQPTNPPLSSWIFQVKSKSDRQSNTPVKPDHAQSNSPRSAYWNPYPLNPVICQSNACWPEMHPRNAHWVLEEGESVRVCVEKRERV